MERGHTPLTTWFWGAYLVASHTPGMSAVQFQRQLGLKRYETAFQILHKLRASMVRPDIDRIGGVRGEYVELDETHVGGKTRGEGRTPASGSTRPRKWPEIEGVTGPTSRYPVVRRPGHPAIPPVWRQLGIVVDFHGV